MGSVQPKPARRIVDAALLRVGFEKLIQDTNASLTRYSPEQIEKSKVLTARKQRLSFYEQCLKDFDYRTANSIRKAKRKTYLIGVFCPGCLYTARVTRKWLDVAPLVCPNTACVNRGKPFEEMEVDKARKETATELVETLNAFQEEHKEERAECAHEYRVNDGYLDSKLNGKMTCLWCEQEKP